MKKLYLIRHAKSSWTYDVSDHDRPLGKRGRSDVINMGKYLIENQKAPEKVICSTASRALYTALHLCDQMNLDEVNVMINSDLYHSGTSDILEIIGNSPNCNILAIVGHNPGLTDLSNFLTHHKVENIPTCGIIGLSFDIKKWSEIKSRKGIFNFFYYPKGI